MPAENASCTETSQQQEGVYTLTRKISVPAGHVHTHPQTAMCQQGTCTLTRKQLCAGHREDEHEEAQQAHHAHEHGARLQEAGHHRAQRGEAAGKVRAGPVGCQGMRQGVGDMAPTVLGR
jgi:hypothetical protein